MKTGTEIYYRGDICNQEGFFKVDEIKVDDWGTHLRLVEIDGDRDFWIDEVMIHHRDEGHGGTRFVTRKAYDERRAAIVEQFSKRATA